MVHLTDDTDFVGIVTGVLQGNRLTPFIFIISQDYVLRASIDVIKENRFTFKKKEETDDLS